MPDSADTVRASNAPDRPASEAAMDPPMGLTRQVTRALLGVAGLAVAAVAVGFVVFARNAAEVAAPADPRADGIVVLTGDKARIDNGLRLLAEGRGSRLLISGVNPIVTEEALAGTVATEFDRALACCVDLGHAARDTFGNAAETRRWANARHFTSLLVVTSDYHMQRSLAELADAMPDVALVPVPITTADVRLADWWRDPGAFVVLAREYGKYLVSLARLTFVHGAASAAAGDSEGE